MEKAGGVFFCMLMLGVLGFALDKIYSHKDLHWEKSHPEHMVSITAKTSAPAAKASLPCRH